MQMDIEDIAKFVDIVCNAVNEDASPKQRSAARIAVIERMVGRIRPVEGGKLTFLEWQASRRRADNAPIPGEEDQRFTGFLYDAGCWIYEYEAKDGSTHYAAPISNYEFDDHKLSTVELYLYVNHYVSC